MNPYANAPTPYGAPQGGGLAPPSNYGAPPAGGLAPPSPYGQQYPNQYPGGGYSPADFMPQVSLATQYPTMGGYPPQQQYSQPTAPVYAQPTAPVYAQPTAPVYAPQARSAAALLGFFLSFFPQYPVAQPQYPVAAPVYHQPVVHQPVAVAQPIAVAQPVAVVRAPILYTMQLGCTNIDRKDLFSKSDPFLLISARKVPHMQPHSMKTGGHSTGEWTIIHKTETIMNNHKPVYRPFTIDLVQLCNGNLDQTFLIECYDWDAGTSELCDFCVCVSLEKKTMISLVSGNLMILSLTPAAGTTPVVATTGAPVEVLAVCGSFGQMSSMLRKLEGLVEEKEQEFEETMSSRAARSTAAPYQWSRTVERKLAELESVKRELKETRQQQRHLQSLDYDMEFDYGSENRPLDGPLPGPGSKRQRGGRRSAYSAFCAEARPVIKVWNPRLRDKQIAARLSEMWKAMSEEERAPFEEQNLPSKHHRVDDELKQKVLNFLDRKVEVSAVGSSAVEGGDENAPPEERRECEEAMAAPEAALEGIACKSTDEEELRAAIAMSLHQSNTSAELNEAMSLSVSLNTMQQPNFVTVRDRGQDERQHDYSLKAKHPLDLDLDDIFN